MKKKKTPKSFELEKQPVEILIQIAHNLPIEQVINWCQTNKRFNEQICKNHIFWFKKIQTDFDTTPKTYYQKYLLDYNQRNYYRINVVDDTDVETGLYLLPFEKAVEKIKGFYGNFEMYINKDLNIFYYNDYSNYFLVDVTGPNLDLFREAVISKSWKPVKYSNANIYESIKTWYHKNDFNSILKVIDTPEVKTPKTPSLDILKIVLKILKLQQLEKLPHEYLMPAIENLDIETISKFCDGSLIFNDKVCNNNKYWIEKFKKDFNESPETYQETYIKLYKEKNWYHISSHIGFNHKYHLLPFEKAVVNFTFLYSDFTDIKGKRDKYLDTGKNYIEYNIYGNWVRVWGPDLDRFENAVLKIN